VDAIYNPSAAVLIVEGKIRLQVVRHRFYPPEPALGWFVRTTTPYYIEFIAELLSQPSHGCCLLNIFCQVAKMKAQLAKAGQPGGFAMLDNNGRLPQNLLVAGYDRYSAYDLTWQSLHMAAAAACRGSTATGGKGGWGNAVLVRNTPDKKTCAQICAQTIHNNCDAEVSIYGKNGKATQNGQIVGYFYNYDCNHADNGGSEVSVSDKTVMNYSYAYFSFCCCRK